MKVTKIVANIKADNTDEAKAFYGDLFGLKLAADVGWFKSFVSGEQMSPQMNIATNGGAGTEVADISIEVDDIEEALTRVIDNNIDIDYGPVTEPWGVRRFYIRDPFGKLLNVMQYV